jgi:hypothetical protein
MDLREESVGGRELNSSGSGQDRVAGSYKHDNEPSRSIEGGEFLYQVGDY